MRVRLIGGVAVAGLGLVLTAGCASSLDDEDIGTQSSAIQGGTADTTRSYSVGVCVGGTTNGDCPFVCTGTLIAPNLVVTARHCVQDVPNPAAVKCTDRFGGSHGTARVTTHHRLNQGTTGWHGVRKIYVPRDGDEVCGNDIALLILSDNVAPSEAKPVTPAVQYSLLSAENRFRRLTAIGYGKTSPAANDSGTRRILQNIPVACIPGHASLDCGSLSDRITKTEFYTGDGTCGGDSGSGALEQSSFDRGEPLVFGVLSRGGEEDDTCVGGVYTRLDSWREFIVNVATEAATTGGYATPAWTVASGEEEDGGVSSNGTNTNLATLGQACAKDAECRSGTCAPLDGTSKSKVCSEACISAQTPSTCQDGYVCRSGFCYAASNGTTTTTTTTSSGCALAASKEGESTAPWKALGWAAFALGGLLARRTRRS